eukprot:13129209-Alexandrium_andersonii.AAC.1
MFVFTERDRACCSARCPSGTPAGQLRRQIRPQSGKFRGMRPSGASGGLSDRDVDLGITRPRTQIPQRS